MELNEIAIHDLDITKVEGNVEIVFLTGDKYSRIALSPKEVLYLIARLANA